jgi:hypothetical protein
MRIDSPPTSPPSVANLFWRTLAVGLALWCAATTHAWAIEKITLWPTILFLRGQDLCQFQDAYGKSRNELAMQATGQLKELLYTGVASRDALEVLVVIDGLIDKNRAQATQGQGMDITLEATLKAGIDAVSRGVNPENTRLEFANNTPVIDLINALKQGKRFDTPDLQQMSRVKGFAWGAYSFAPSCRGDLLVTLHVVLPRGETVNFQAQGRPEQVMSAIALQMVWHFQRTSFPTLISMGDKFIVLVGAPGTSINTAPTPKVAEQACKAIKARLPIESEYDFLSILGDWNGGVSLGHQFWALADNHIMSPDTRNPSPVRHPEEVNGKEFSFYCVR